jgi:hypothetical protein
MADRFEGLRDLEWRLFADIMPPEPTTRGRGMPHTPFRKVVNTLLSLLSTGRRWCDRPRGHGERAGLPTVWPIAGCSAGRRMAPWRRCRPGGSMMIQWEYGTVDGAFAPWDGLSGGGFFRRQHDDGLPSRVRVSRPG